MRYAVLAIGFVLILQNAGVNLTAFSVLAGAVGVGVGFGLQNIFSNFISGLIIMLERPIKVGDRVEMGGIEGTVLEIGVRRTTVITATTSRSSCPTSVSSSTTSSTWSTPAADPRAGAGDGAPRLRRARRRTAHAKPRSHRR